MKTKAAVAMGPLGRLRSHLHATFQAGPPSLIRCSRDYMRGNAVCCQSSSNADGKRGRQQRNGSAAALAPPGGHTPPCSLQQGQICHFDFYLPGQAHGFIDSIFLKTLCLVCGAQLTPDPGVGCSVSDRHFGSWKKIFIL